MEIVPGTCEITTQGLDPEILHRVNDIPRIYMISSIIINCPLADGLSGGENSGSESRDKLRRINICGKLVVGEGMWGSFVGS